MTSLVEKYRPRELSAFIDTSDARTALNALAANPYSSSWLLLGPSGLGKTTMAIAFCESINAELHHIPSRQCDLETIDRVTAACWYRPMFGHTFHVIVIDEANKITKPAQLSLLSKLDCTAMPPDTIFLFTANETDGLEERFLSRCRILEFSADESANIALLKRVWRSETSAPLPDIDAIVESAGGNIRASLNSLETELLLSGASVCSPVPDIPDNPPDVEPIAVPESWAKRIQSAIVIGAIAALWAIPAAKNAYRQFKPTNGGPNGKRNYQRKRKA